MKDIASVYAATGPGVPGTTGTPIFIAACGGEHKNPKFITEPYLTNIASLCLVSELVNDLRSRAYEGQSSLLDFSRKFCVLRQESVSATLNEPYSDIYTRKHLPGVNHIYAMLDSDPDNIVLC